MNKRARSPWLLVTAVTAACTLAFGQTTEPSAHDAPRAPLVLVSLPALRLRPNERVVGFHFKLTSGRVAMLSDMPAGWDISVDNDPSWNTKVDASIVVAAAATDASYFKDFAVIEEEQDAENPFGIAGDVDVSAEFSKVRKIPVTTKDFAIRPVPSWATRRRIPATVDTPSK